MSKFFAGLLSDFLAIVNGDTSPQPILDASGVPVETNAAASKTIVSYFGRGVFASRPASPSVASGASASYLATDTGKFYVWTGSAWAGTN